MASRARRPGAPQAHDEFEAIGEFVWSLRVELLIVAALAGGFAGAHFGLRLPPLRAGEVLAIAVVAVAAIPGAGRGLWRMLRRSALRRSWDEAIRSAGLGRVRVERADRIPVGSRLTVCVGAGMAVEDLREVQPRLAAALAVQSLRIEADADHAGRAAVTLVRRRSAVAGPWPWLEEPRSAWPWRAEPVSLWSPVPVGVDDDGEVVAIPLVERNLLVGGLPGAGKSVLLSMVCAAGALDADSRLWLIDAKKVELAAWASSAERFVGPDVLAATALLAELAVVMERRYDDLLAADPPRKKISRDAGMPLHLLVVDELAEFTAGEDKKASADFTSALRTLVSRGRAAGVIVVCATQKPSDRIVPTELRDLFAYRMAMRTSTPQMSDVALGQGWAAQGFSSATIADGDAGLGFLLAEDGRPRRVRTFFLSDGDVRRLSARARDARVPMIGGI